MMIRSNESAKELTVTEVAELTLRLVDVISKMDPKELNKEIYNINYYNMSYFSRISSLVWGVEQSAKTSLEIASDVFKDATHCQKNSVNAQLLQVLIKKIKPEGLELQDKNIEKLNLFVSEKIKFELKQIEAQKNKPIEPVQEEKKVVNNTESMLKKLKVAAPEKVFKTNSELEKYLKSQSRLLANAPEAGVKKKTVYDQAPDHAVLYKNKNGGKVKPAVQVNSEIKQPVSFKR